MKLNTLREVKRPDIQSIIVIYSMIWLSKWNFFSWSCIIFKLISPKSATYIRFSFLVMLFFFVLLRLIGKKNTLISLTMAYMLFMHIFILYICLFPSFSVGTFSFSFTVFVFLLRFEPISLRSPQQLQLIDSILFLLSHTDCVFTTHN